MTNYRRLPAVERKLSGGRVLVQPLDRTTPVELAGSAPVVWDLLRNRETTELLLGALLDHYTDSPDAIERGCDAALEMLNANGLIEELQ